MTKKKTRSQLRKERYNRIVLETGNVSLARQYRDLSPARIKAELDIDLSKPSKRKKRRAITKKEWGAFSDKKKPKEFPTDILAYAISINRQVGADDYDKYGFIYAYKRVVEGKGEKTIDREVVFDNFNQKEIYTESVILPNTR